MKNVGELKRLAAVWTLRILTDRHGFRQFLKERSWAQEEILKTAGLDDLIDQELEAECYRREFISQLKKMRAATGTKSTSFFYNLNRLADMVGLSAMEKLILTFSLLAKEVSGLEEALKFFGDANYRELMEKISRVLKLPLALIQTALDREGLLRSSGLLKLDFRGTMSIPDRLEPLHQLGNALHGSKLKEVEGLLSSYFYKSPPSLLRIQDFSHLADDVGIVLDFLKPAIQNKITGVNLLLYGPPGTGKTELARMVAAQLHACLYEVGNQDEDGDAIQNQRFASYQLCQRFLMRRSDCMVLFDEVEDVFPATLHSFFGLLQESGQHKSWTNDLLETNPIPAIWISNSVEQIDPAFLRRFDLIVEVPIPPQSNRRQILEKVVSGLPVSKDWLNRMARNEHISPGHAEKAARVARISQARAPEQVEKVLSKVIGNAHRAMGFRDGQGLLDPEGTGYDLRFLNPDCNLEEVTDSIAQLGRGKVCLYGPSGSGKTKFVHFLGQKLQKTVIVKHASDILGPYVGQTEQHLAAMFRQVHREQEILFLDEADSFLQSRAGAHHSWEVTQVNELLVQMEAFNGLFFCATNLLDLLDNAVFRRFDLKVKFDYLRQDQTWELFKTYMAKGGKPVSSREKHTWKKKLASLRFLTPGDFATVMRRLTLTNTGLRPDAFYQGLEKEIAVKCDAKKRSVGFGI
ncbi:MAG: AAA family ATPase [Thermodesulfobacteriota bacterium]